MTLSRQVKAELVRIEDDSSCCSSWELKALLIRGGSYSIRSSMHTLNIEAGDSAIARRIFQLLRKAGIASPEIAREQEKRLTRNRYIVQVPGREQIDALLIYLGLKEAGELIKLPHMLSAVPKRNCCRRAFMRGVFLAGGSISASRRSGYHLEINCGSLEDALIYRKTLAYFHLSPLLRQRKDNVFLYFKNAEAIADYLRIIGAGGALLKFESLRVVKSMRNQVNRLVNCDTANLEKVVRSSQKQLDLINQIDARVGLNNISPRLREAAQLRRRHPESSLKELGEMIEPPVGKSGINHRFRQMEKLLEKQARLKNGQ